MSENKEDLKWKEKFAYERSKLIFSVEAKRLLDDAAAKFKVQVDDLARRNADAASRTVVSVTDVRTAILAFYSSETVMGLITGGKSLR